METTMNQCSTDQSVIKEGIAKVLNATGTGMVLAWDYTVLACKKSYKLLKKTGKAKGMFTKGLATIQTSETKQIQEKIVQYQKKIQALYFEIGKEGAKVTDGTQPLESDPVKQLISEVREYENEINRLTDRMIAIQKEKQAKAAQKRSIKQQKSTATEISESIDFKKVNRNLESAINKACRQGTFDSLSEREIFNKVANDLLDNDIEIKMLAASELGKLKLKAAVPVLMAAADYNISNLTSEIVNALIAIDDPLAIPLFKKKRLDPKFTVRIACLRGIYKNASNEDAVNILSEGLRDRHPEVRRTAATFIGWRDLSDAVPALLQSLRDSDNSVRKATITALANLKDDSTVLPIIKLLGDKELEVREKAYDAIVSITDEKISFDVHLFGQALTDGVNNVRDWWQETRLKMVKEDLLEEDDTDGYLQFSTEKPVSAFDKETINIDEIDAVDETLTDNFTSSDEVDEHLAKAVQALDKVTIDQSDRSDDRDVSQQTKEKDEVDKQAVFNNKTESDINENSIIETEDSEAEDSDNETNITEVSDNETNQTETSIAEDSETETNITEVSDNETNQTEISIAETNDHSDIDETETSEDLNVPGEKNVSDEIPNTEDSKKNGTD